MDRFAKVSIRGINESKNVQITSDSKPGDFDTVVSKWQTLIDTLARIIDVPSGLIMRLNSDNIEVFLKSDTAGNPYKENEKAELIYGLYCESVIGLQQPLIVPDATKSKTWKDNNPDIDLNMISYLGVPINWPDGECFGTVCVLDNKENHYNQDFLDLITQIKQHIELDLKILLSNKELKELNEIKTKFMSLISHDVRGNMATLHQFLQLITSDFENMDAEEMKNSLISLSQISSTSFNTLDNILKWSKNDLVHLEPEIQPVNINELIEELLSFFNHVIQLKSIQVYTSLFAEKIIIHTDRNMLSAILRNLISNAIKFNRKDGELEIKVALINNRHQISIKDTGIGISKVNLKKLFKDNVQQASGTSGESSTGIGLLIVNEFIDKIGAGIQVESKIDEGTKFIIEL